MDHLNFPCSRRNMFYYIHILVGRSSTLLFLLPPRPMTQELEHFKSNLRKNKIKSSFGLGWALTMSSST